MVVVVVIVFDNYIKHFERRVEWLHFRNIEENKISVKTRLGLTYSVHGGY